MGNLVIELDRRREESLVLRKSEASTSSLRSRIKSLARRSRLHRGRPRNLLPVWIFLPSRLSANTFRAVELLDDQAESAMAPPQGSVPVYPYNTVTHPSHMIATGLNIVHAES